MKLSKNISSLFLFVSLVQAVAFKLTSRTYTDDTLSKQQKNNNQFKRLEEKPFSGYSDDAFFPLVCTNPFKFIKLEKFPRLE